MPLGDSLNFDVTADTRSAAEQLRELAERADELGAKIEDLDDETIEIRASGSGLADLKRDIDDVADDLGDLQATADRGIDIDVDVDRAGNAGRAADDVRRLNTSAEGLQRGIGPLRGFTDELGGAASAGGTAANAIIDAGEAVEIFGSQLGISEQALGKASLALGALGLATGVGLAAWQKYKDGQAETRREIRETTSAIEDQLLELGLLADQADRLASVAARSTDPFDQFAAALFGALDEEQTQKARRELAELDLTVADLADVFRGVNTDDVGFFTEQLARFGVDPSQIDSIAAAAAATDNFESAVNRLKQNTDFDAADVLDADRATLEPIIEALQDLRDLTDDQNIADVVRNLLDAIETDGGRAAQVLADVRAELGADAGDLAVYGEVLERLQAIERETEQLRPSIAAGFAGDVVERFVDITNRARDVVENARDSIEDASRVSWVDQIRQIGDMIAAADALPDPLQRVIDYAGQVADAFERQSAALDELQTRVDDERLFTRIAEQFERATGDDATRDDVLTLLDLVLSLGDAIDDLPKDQIIRLYSEIDRGNFDAAAQLLADLTADRSVRITIDPDDDVRFAINRDGAAAPTRITSPIAGVEATPVIPVTQSTTIYAVNPGTEQVAAAQADDAFAQGPRPV